METATENKAVGLIKYDPADETCPLKVSRVVWVLCDNPTALIEAPDANVIIGNNEAEVEDQLEERYSSPAGCTLIQKTSFYANLKPDVPHSDNIEHGHLTAYCVLKYPRVFTDTLRCATQGFAGPLQKLRQLCLDHGRVLLSCNAFPLHSEQTVDAIREAGLIFTEGEFGYQKVHYNPSATRAVVTRRANLEYKLLMSGFLPQSLLGPLGEAVNPNNWGNFSHPWSEWVHGKQGDIKSGYGRRHHYGYHDTPCYDANDILRYSQLFTRLWPKHFIGGPPDHNYNNARLTAAVIACLPYYYGLLHSQDTDYRRLARWLRRVAKLNQLEIPAKPVNPRPPKKKGRTCRRVNVVAPSEPTPALSVSAATAA